LRDERERELVLRRVELRGFALPVDRLVVDRFEAGLPAIEERLLLAELLARLVPAFFPVLCLAVERFADDFFAPLLRDELEDDPELAVASTDHFPVITRCAASATASAIREPSLVALAMTLLAACEAVSAASRPASRIARRAFGLALIAAAAAASPAASISLLIAALASLSTVSLLLFDEEPEELLRADLAIASSPPFTKRHFRAVTVPE
jgi:hypothetical protein